VRLSYTGYENTYRKTAGRAAARAGPEIAGIPGKRYTKNKLAGLKNECEA
jgi:hypothetical protein